MRTKRNVERSQCRAEAMSVMAKRETVSAEGGASPSRLVTSRLTAKVDLRVNILSKILVQATLEHCLSKEFNQLGDEEGR